jgi:MOSC domain-containing protein YiiM
MRHLTTAELESGVARIREAPLDGGTLELIVRRPAIDEREVLESAALDKAIGLIGDSWIDRPSSRSDDGGPHPDMQLNVMSARAAALVAGDRERWPLAGDQLYVDLALGPQNLPPGTRLQLGTAIIEVTDQPHRGCAKFAARFGRDALRFVNSPTGIELSLRGINARVVVEGTVSRGDVVTVLRQPVDGA